MTTTRAFRTPSQPKLLSIEQRVAAQEQRMAELDELQEEVGKLKLMVEEFRPE